AKALRNVANVLPATLSSGLNPDVDNTAAKHRIANSIDLREQSTDFGFINGEGHTVLPYSPGLRTLTLIAAASNLPSCARSYRTASVAMAATVDTEAATNSPPSKLPVASLIQPIT